MADDKLQLQRLELKYLIPEATALAVRDFVSSYLDIDEYGATQPNYSYPVHSLYLDSDLLTLYWHTINGNKNRYKLRLRFYNESVNAPVYFEIKRRVNNAILKQRAGVRRDAVEYVLAGHLPEIAHLETPSPQDLANIQRFSQLMQEHHTKPKAHVAYLREAWISSYSNSVRVTMDRDVRCEPEPTARLETEMLNPVQVFGRNVVLELKYTGKFPDWFREMVRVFGLQQCSAAKYVDGVALAGERRFSLGNYVPPTDPLASENLRARKTFLYEHRCGIPELNFA